MPGAHIPNRSAYAQEIPPQQHLPEGESEIDDGIELQADGSVAYPGLEVDRRTPILHEKQVAGSQDPEVAPATASSSSPDRGRWRARWIIIGCILIFIVIAVTVLVPVGLLVIGKKDKGSKEPVIADESLGSPSGPSPPSKDGVLKGTRLASMDPRTGGDIFVYYQNGDGSLRYISMSPTRVWQGSRILPVDDAMMGTPLAATHTVSNGSTTWWLFYVDESNVIQNIYSHHNPADWQKGNVGDKQYTVPAQSSIAFTVARGRTYDSKRKDLGGGLTLFTSDADGRVHEYIYNEDDTSWSDGFTFTNTNGYGGASVWSQNNEAYLFTLSNTQLIDLWWRDYNDNDSDSAGQNAAWHLGPSSNAAVIGNTSMCGQFAFAYQGANGEIQGSNFTKPTKLGLMRWDTAYDISDNDAMDSSALSCWYFFPSNGDGKQEQNTMFHVFYQSEGGEIREAKRYWGADNATVPGTWQHGNVPIR
ncbi:hypothetical protein GX50_01045 [[Emmonsia] crescens]|uniref:Fucose-specific lectin n=1 Tax=[Emmonsia] crescens TaxID=73230 RepID=A0A2B7ZSM2_9EURO|nr:hypothetical protein GX50_01045 [Emmonsia crescens]